MPESLVLVLLAAAGALVILGLGLVLFHRFADQDVVCPPMPAAYRRGAAHWRRGTLRFTEDRLAVRGPGGLSDGPWMRGDLDLGVASALGEDVALQLGRRDLIQVPVRYGTVTFDLALDEQHYTALRAWVEAVPPGYRQSRVA